jgi:hypothetical protein
MPTSYDHLFDGLYTYSLSVLCEPAAAAAAVLEVRRLAQRHGDRLADPALRRAWLYAAARCACVRRLPEAGRAAVDELPGELAALAWPEAAGITAEQREVLELTLRHRLDETELAAVLELPAAEAARLLTAARAELAATRRVLLALDDGGCPELARLGGSGEPPVLGPALRRELVGHLSDCPTCRGIAERTDAPAAEPRLLAAPPGLREAPDPAVPPAQPHFDAAGFPRHRAPAPVRRPGYGLPERLVLVRQRALTTGVLAAVLAAPLMALWVAHQDGSPTTGAAAVSSVRVDSPAPEPDTDEGAVPVAPLPAAGSGTAIHGVPAALVGTTTDGTGAETLLPRVLGAAVPVPGPGAVPLSSPLLHADPLPAASGLSVEAGSYGNRTVLTLTNTSTAPLDWHAVLSCDWLRLSRDSGTLEPGQRITVIVTVDDQHAPDGEWLAQISLPPSQDVVTLEGGPGLRGVPGPPTSSPSGFTPSPSANPSGSASATPSDGPSAGSSASTPPSSSASPSASPTSGVPVSASPGSTSPGSPSSGRPSPGSPSSTPSTRPTATPTPSESTSASTPDSTTSPSPSSPAR